MTNHLQDKLNLPISELELLSPIIFSGEECKKDMLDKLRIYGHGIASVIQDKILIGHIYEHKIVENYHSGKFAKDFASPILYHLTINSTIKEAMKLSVIKNLYYLPVINPEGITVSYLSVRNLIEYILALFGDEISKLGTLFEWDTFSSSEHDGDISTFGTNQEDNSINKKFYLRELQVLDSHVLWTIDRSDSLEAARLLMVNKNVSVIAVTEYETKIFGVFSERDFLTKISLDSSISLENQRLDQHCTVNPDLMHSEHRICYAINNILVGNYRNVLIVNSDKVPLSYISLVDILRYIVKILLT